MTTPRHDDDDDCSGVVDYGYGDAAPDSATIYGYGDAAPDSAVDYGYGEATRGHGDVGVLTVDLQEIDGHDDKTVERKVPPSRRTRGGDGITHQRHAPDRSKSDDVLYHPDHHEFDTDTDDDADADAAGGGGGGRSGRSGGDGQGGRQRYRRRGSVTRYSLVASNQVIEEFTEHANIIDQFRNMKVGGGTGGSGTVDGRTGRGGDVATPGAGVMSTFDSTRSMNQTNDNGSSKSSFTEPLSPSPSSPMSGTLSPGKPFRGEWNQSQDDQEGRRQQLQDPTSPSPTQDLQKKKKRHLRLVKKMRRRFSTTA